MNKRIKRNNKLGIFSLIILLTTTFSMVGVSSTQQVPQENFRRLNYTTSVPLYIDNDSDLVGNSSSGSGTAIDPYVIENLEIITTDTYGIYIRDTTVNFAIRNCFIEANIYGIYIYLAAERSVEIDNNILDDSPFGIRIIGSDYANITNNYCDGSTSYGINVDTAAHALVKNNTCINGATGIYGTLADYCNYIDNKLHQNTEYGLRIVDSDYCNATENICYNNNYAGIYVGSSTLTSIWDNECYDNSYHGIATFSDTNTDITFNVLHDNTFNGIFIQFSVDGNIANNTVYSNDGTGILIAQSTGTLIADNTLTNDGFRFNLSSLVDYGTLSVSNNMVNGKQLGFYYDTDDTIFSSNIFGQLVLAACDNSVVKDLTISQTDYAVALIGCDSTVVDNCDFNNNVGGSVLLEGTMNCTVNNTLCNHNPTKPGIFVGGGIDTVIQNCTSSNNMYGLQMVSSTNSTILNSTFNQNTITNAYIAEGAAGNIKYNAFTNAGSVGLMFVNFDYVNISHNLFESNTGYALHLDASSTGSWIHHNAFISNNLGGTSQAFDDTNSLNMWDDPWNMEGNYWNDHVSGNYTLDGAWGVNDTYPLSSIPPGVPELGNLTYIIFIVPVIFVNALIIRRRKK